MSNLDWAYKGGGIFALLTFIHFSIDWFFQSHDEAMSKHTNWKVRAKHCTIYTVPFLPLLWWLGLTPIELLVSSVILFGSHFLEDTYYPVLLWCKYIRRPPSMQWSIDSTVHGGIYLKGPITYVGNLKKTQDIDANQIDWKYKLISDIMGKGTTIQEAQKELDRRGFIEFIDSTLGKILMIVIDQIIHLCFLWPIVWIVLN